MTSRREEKALLEFKHILDDVVHLLRRSTGADTVYFYWVNRSRRQFVLETNSAGRADVMFQDRMGFEQFFLDRYKDADEVIQLEIGKDISGDELTYYHNEVPSGHMTLIPFINNGETVSLTVVETTDLLPLEEHEEVISAYRNALVNVLNTYLELTDLYENQQEWIDYEESLGLFSPKMHKVDILNIMAEEMQKLLMNGGVNIIARGMGTWTSVLRSERASDIPGLGLMAEEKSLAYEALQKGKPMFAMHFNQNPKRISTAEKKTEGATIAIPMMISGHRHAVVLAYDQNPLTFKESVKHQLINFVRIAGLSIQVNLGKMGTGEELLTSEYGSFIPDVWEKSLEKQIRRSGVSRELTWFGFITIENLQEVRSRLRLEQLKLLQRKVIEMLNPSKTGFQGFVGFNTDYVYSYLLIGHSEQEHEKWMTNLHKLFEEKVEINVGEKVKIRLKTGSVKLNNPEDELHDVIKAAKRSLSGSFQESSSQTLNF